MVKILEIQDQFVHSSELAQEVGYDLLEVHCAHGYLLHSFLTPLVNTRDDEYGGDLRGRARFLLETVEKVRAVWPTHKVLSVRMSVDDFAANGLTLEDTAQVGLWLKDLGVDILDCSGGGAVPEARGAIGNRTGKQPDSTAFLSARSSKTEWFPRRRTARTTAFNGLTDFRVTLQAKLLHARFRLR